MNDEEYYNFVRPYADAMQMLLTRLDVLNHNLYGKSDSRPIHYIQNRIKKKKSLEEKLVRRGKEPTVDNAKDYLQDIAGVRIICYFVDDIYNLAKSLKRQADLIVIREQDYIKAPKPNGYRSYHLIVGVPVYCMDGMEYFPVEVNRASYQTLLRVPGIGYKSAERIVKARRMNKLTFDDLKKIGVVLKRALYFITCSGKMMYNTKLEENYICQNLMRDKTQIPKDIRESGYQQLSFFDQNMRADFHLTDTQIIPPGQQITVI